MRVLVIGAGGTIGQAIVEALRGHEVIRASRTGDVKVDISDPASIAAMYRTVGRVDGVICVGGSARFGPLAQLGDADFAFSLANKLMGQVNLVRLGVDAVADGGSFTLTSGVLSQHPMPGSAAISLVNAGVEGFVRAAALELPRGIRVNVVSPGWVSETLAAMGMDPSHGTPAEQVARTYVAALTGHATGATLAVPASL